jgi:hypothetical protein
MSALNDWRASANDTDFMYISLATFLGHRTVGADHREVVEIIQKTGATRQGLRGFESVCLVRGIAERLPRSTSLPSVPMTVTSPWTSIGPLGRSVIVTPAGVGWDESEVVMAAP